MDSPPLSFPSNSVIIALSASGYQGFLGNRKSLRAPSEAVFVYLLHHHCKVTYDTGNEYAW